MRHWENNSTPLLLATTRYHKPSEDKNRKNQQVVFCFVFFWEQEFNYDHPTNFQHLEKKTIVNY